MEEVHEICKQLLSMSKSTCHRSLFIMKFDYTIWGKHDAHLSPMSVFICLTNVEIITLTATFHAFNDFCMKVPSDFVAYSIDDTFMADRFKLFVYSLYVYLGKRRTVR